MNVRLLPSSIARCTFGVAALACLACVRTTTSGAGSESSAVTARTVFSDSVLFRQMCLQADSGLSPSIARCTLRYQGIEIRPVP